MGCQSQSYLTFEEQTTLQNECSNEASLAKKRKNWSQCWIWSTMCYGEKNQYWLELDSFE